MKIKPSRKAIKINQISQSVDELDQWYRTPLGEYVDAQVTHALEDFLSTCFGYYTVSIGVNPAASELLGKCRVRHLFHLGQAQQNGDALINPTSLPIATDSIDLVVLNHALSLAGDPHAILREVNRILIPDGKLIIIDFNPISFWGLRHLVQGWLDRAPWAGHYYTARRLKDWANLLGFELDAQYCAGYALPFNLRRLVEKSRVLDKFSQRWLRFSGAVNILIFEKHTIPLTPFKNQWARQRLLPTRVIRPTVGRDMKYDR